MIKIPTLFLRSEDQRRVIDSVAPGCEWVAAGEGWATQKIDGTCCLIREGRLFRRAQYHMYIDYHVCGRPVYVCTRDMHPDYREMDFDLTTLISSGWIPVEEGPEDRWHREGLETTKTLYRGGVIPDGTYELIGPKVQNNPEKVETHHLVRHGASQFKLAIPRTFDALREYFTAFPTIEGVVWHRLDGRMVKIKLRDFGIKRLVV